MHHMSFWVEGGWGSFLGTLKKMGVVYYIIFKVFELLKFWRKEVLKCLIPVYIGEFKRSKFPFLYSCLVLSKGIFYSFEIFFSLHSRICSLSKNILFEAFFLDCPFKFSNASKLLNLVSQNF